MTISPVPGARDGNGRRYAEKLYGMNEDVKEIHEDANPSTGAGITRSVK
jgi:hypothetical protein